MGEPFILSLEIETEAEIRGGHVTLELKTSEGVRVTLMLSLDCGFHVFTTKGRHIITCVVNGLVLPPGQYLADAGITGSATARSWDVIFNFPLFMVGKKSQRLRPRLARASLGSAVQTVQTWSWESDHSGIVPTSPA